MDHVKDVAEVVEAINIMAGYGYRSNANEMAAIHALNNAIIHRGRKRKRIIEDALSELFVHGAVFGMTDTYRACLEAIDAIDSAAKIGVELSVQDVLEALQ